MASREPDWKHFRIDPIMDTPGRQMAKLLAFMEQFIDWREEIHTTSPERRNQKKQNGHKATAP